MIITKGGRKKPIIVFDIDGTLADNRHRQSLLGKDGQNWDLFFQAMGDDHPREPVVQLCRDLHSLGKYELVLFTGRPERYRRLTEQWLTWNNIPPLSLTMRKDGDRRHDAAVKEDMLDTLLNTGATIAFVVDDRNSVVAMWRRRGITCLQCAEGDF